MADGDEWIYVLSREENPSKNAGDGGAEESTGNDAAQADEDGEEARSDGGSYGSTEVNEYLDYIEDVEKEDDAATGGDAVAEALRALAIGEAAPGAAVSRVASGGGDRGKAAVVENPYYDCYGGGPTDAEAYYGGGQDYGYGYGYEYGLGSGSAWRGYVTGTSSVSGSGSGSASRGYEPGSGSGSGSGSASRGYYGSGYDDDGYGTGGYGYNRYGYGGDAYGYAPGYGYGYDYGDAYGYGYGDAYGYGYGDAYGYGYGYGGYAYDPRSVLYRAPPAYGGVPYYPSNPYTYPVQGARYAPPSRRHPPRASEPPAVGPPQPDPSASI
ncbi:glycine-rich cell wall structural protein 1.8-like [Setaria italica]|uniref:glycine-rich cell wall structural protein 1.8-like n=1 Tax=Setaria italica TaxID=4555 RepID=UPI000350928A|nr:glycine-rich cell wall structural protein 1.8-like [Setaria italica]